MYEINNKLYRFSLKCGDYYTGKVIETDEHSIKITTIKSEEIIIAKSEISKAKEIVDGREYRN